MNLNIRFKGMTSSDAIKEHLDERTKKLAKFLPPTTIINATLKEDKTRKIAEINLFHKGVDYIAKQKSDNILNSIDDAVDKLRRQLAKTKDKKSDHSQARAQKEPSFELEEEE